MSFKVTTEQTQEDEESPEYPEFLSATDSGHEDTPEHHKHGQKPRPLLQVVFQHLDSLTGELCGVLQEEQKLL